MAVVVVVLVLAGMAVVDPDNVPASSSSFQPQRFERLFLSISISISITGGIGGIIGRGLDGPPSHVLPSHSFMDGVDATVMGDAIVHQSGR